MYTADIISVIPAAMKFHAERAEVQEAAAQLLMSVAAQGGYCTMLGIANNLYGQLIIHFSKRLLKQIQTEI